MQVRTGNNLKIKLNSSIAVIRRQRCYYHYSQVFKRVFSFSLSDLDPLIV